MSARTHFLTTREARYIWREYLRDVLPLDRIEGQFVSNVASALRAHGEHRLARRLEGGELFPVDEADLEWSELLSRP